MTLIKEDTSTGEDFKVQFKRKSMSIYAKSDHQKEHVDSFFVRNCRYNSTRYRNWKSKNDSTRFESLEHLKRNGSKFKVRFNSSVNIKLTTTQCNIYVYIFISIIVNRWLKLFILTANN